MDGIPPREFLQRIVGEVSEYMRSQYLEYESSPRAENSTTPVAVAEGQGRSSTTVPSSLNSELGHLFSPYPRTQFRLAGRSAGRPALASRSAIGRLAPSATGSPKTWTLKFCCLTGPSDDSSPTSARALVLREIGLGEETIILGTRSTSNDVEAAIRRTFVKLNGVEFQIMRAMGGGQGKPLTRVSLAEPIPSAEILKGTRLTTVYVRPLLELPMERRTNEVQRTLSFTRESARASTSTSDPEADGARRRDNPRASESYLENLQPESMLLNGQSTSGASDTGNATPGAQSDIICLDEYRMKFYEENQGFQDIVVCRNAFLEKLLGVYKDPGLNYKKKTKVHFVGESGTDIGALSKEYFWQGLVSLCNDKLDGKPLFEGESDHRLPSCDAQLLRCGIFKVVGKFMAHATIHSGIAYLGLSIAAAEYILAPVVDSDTPLTLVIKDIPELETREALALVTRLQGSATLTDEEMETIKVSAAAADFLDPISADNSLILYEHLLYHYVIEKRIRQLEAIKEGFRTAGISDFLFERKYLTSAIFPRNRDLLYQPEVIINKIQCSSNHEIVNYVKDFIIETSRRPDGIQKLLCAWTGWAVIPEGALKITVEDDTDFIAQTCFNELKIPSDFTHDKVFEHMSWLVEHANAGFGAM